MVDYTTEKSKEGILTCLILMSGCFDFLINYLINFIPKYLTDYLHLNNFNIYTTFVPFFLIFIGCYVIIYKLFNECIWNKRIVLDYLNIHDLNGNWEGYTETSKYGKKKFKVTIKQTWTTIDMNLKTDQSSSKLISFSFNKSKQMHDICYTYYSEVKQNQKEINSHYGTCILDIDENNEILEGTYFTDEQRGTYGEIYLKRI